MCAKDSAYAVDCKFRFHTELKCETIKKCFAIALMGILDVQFIQLCIINTKTVLDLLRCIGKIYALSHRGDEKSPLFFC